MLTPLTEHEAFDLVAYKEHRFYRVQVKYRAAVRGYVNVAFATSWADRHGVHSVPMDRSFVDVLCIYCPDTNSCYYLDPKTLGQAVRLRIAPSRNHQRQRIRWARDYLEVPWSVRGVAAGNPTTP